jgi:arginyl-tRNA synthetase
MPFYFQLFQESKLKFDEDTEFKSRAYQCVVKLQNGEKEIIDAWKAICDISRKGLDNFKNFSLLKIFFEFRF